MQCCCSSGGTAAWCSPHASSLRRRYNAAPTAATHSACSATPRPASLQPQLLQKHLQQGPDVQGAWHRERGVACQAGKGEAYYRNYKANRARHEGTLLPRPPGQTTLLPLDPLLDYLEKELWAYTLGQPSPHLKQAPSDTTSQRAPEGGPGDQLRQAGAGTAGGGSQEEVGAAAGQAAGPAKDPGRGLIIPPPSQPLAELGAVPPPRLPGRPCPLELSQVHVYWDVEGLHPGNLDPRTLAQRIAGLARCYGRVAGVYAYARRPALNWVPEAFVEYAAAAAGAGAGAGAAAAGGDWVEPSGPRKYRCAVCGLSKRSEPELRAHMAQVHGSSSTGSGTGSSTTAAASASSAAAAGGGAKSGVPMRNSYRRTLGKVALYHTWAGQAVVPPVGHQISLKYALAQEGVEARIVQNAAESNSQAIASGMGRLLDRIRRGEVVAPVGGRLVVILLSDDEAGLQQPLLRLRGVGGAATIAVCSSASAPGGAGEQVQEAEAAAQGSGAGQVPSSPGSKKKGGSRAQSKQDASRAGEGAATAGGSGSKGEARASFRGADLVLSWEALAAGGCAGRAPPDARGVEQTASPAFMAGQGGV